MISLSVSNIKKTYGIDVIFDNVSFSINEREKVAIVGANGAGKTTLFNIITGLEGKDHGDIYIAKDSTIGYMNQNVNITSDKTLLEETITVFADVIQLEKELRHLETEMAKYHENPEKTQSLMKEYAKKTDQFTAMDGYSYQSMARGVLIGLGFDVNDLEKEVNLLSGGEKSRLLLAKILLKKPSILLLDEPTNHLDMDSITWLETFLKNYNATTLIISHDRYFLNSLTSKTIDMSHKTAKLYPCNYENYVIEKEKQQSLALKNYELNQAEIKRQKEVIEKLKAFGREKQVKRARSREKLLEKMDVLDKPTPDTLKSNIVFSCQVRSGKDVLQVKDLSKSFGDRTLFEDVNMDIYASEKIAFIGANGSGKTTFFNILQGLEMPDTGEFSFGVNVNKEYFNQERSDLNMDNTILEEVWNAYPHLKEVEIRNYLAGFLFTGEDVFKKISSLSGGEKSRVSLLKMMLSKSNFLFMDEPTNHLDIDSKEVLEDAICAYDGTVFVISHDRYFLNKVPDRIFELKDGKFIEYLGNYDYMNEKKNELLEMQDFLKTQENTPTKTQVQQQKRKDKQAEAEKRKIIKNEKLLLEKIHTIEKELQEIDHDLCKEEVYSNPTRVKELSLQKTELENSLENLYEQWEDALSLIENMQE